MFNIFIYIRQPKTIQTTTIKTGEREGRGQRERGEREQNICVVANCERSEQREVAYLAGKSGIQGRTSQ